MVHDTSHGDPWHRLKEATKGIRAKDLTYKPVRVPWGWGRGRRRLEILRRVIGHLCAAEAYGNHLAPRTRAKGEDEWDAGPLRKPFNTPRSVIRPVDIVLRRLHARAKAVRDEELAEHCGMWRPDCPKLFVLIDGGTLHTAWHLGQVALLIDMSHARQKEKMAGPTSPASRAPVYPGDRDWSDCHVKSRTEACLKLLEASYRESPWHAIRRMARGLTRGEAVWRPFPKRHPWRSMGGLMRHVAGCKVMYANHAFGGASFDWGDCERATGGELWEETGPRRLLAALDRAQDFLMEHVASATDEDLDRVNPMHHGVPLTGWQVVACMAQHDAWHGGQISILRDSYAALAEKAGQ
jgi:hypothetical protein